MYIKPPTYEAYRTSMELIVNITRAAVAASLISEAIGLIVVESGH